MPLYFRPSLEDPLVTTTLVIRRAPMVKYSPDEARDDHGRWTFGQNAGDALQTEEQARSNGWKPSMPEADAKAWAANSAIKGVVYHGTTDYPLDYYQHGKTVEDTINGNDLFGHGIYLGTSKKIIDNAYGDHARSAAGDVYGTTMSAYVRASKVLTDDSPAFARLSSDPRVEPLADSILSRETAYHAAHPDEPHPPSFTQRGARMVAIQTLAMQEGYQAFKGKWWDQGGDVIVAYDPHTVTFVQDPAWMQIAAEEGLHIKYSPDEARVPAGSSEGGEFTSGEGGSSETNTAGTAEHSAVIGAEDIAAFTKGSALPQPFYFGTAHADDILSGQGIVVPAYKDQVQDNVMGRGAYLTSDRADAAIWGSQTLDARVAVKNPVDYTAWISKLDYNSPQMQAFMEQGRTMGLRPGSEVTYAEQQSAIAAGHDAFTSESSGSKEHPVLRVAVFDPANVAVVRSPEAPKQTPSKRYFVPHIKDAHDVSGEARVPAGSPDGGEWSTSGTVAADSSAYSLDAPDDDQGKGISKPIQAYVQHAVERMEEIDPSHAAQCSDLGDLFSVEKHLTKANAVQIAQKSGLDETETESFQASWNKSSSSRNAVLLDQSAAKVFSVPALRSSRAQTVYNARLRVAGVSSEGGGSEEKDAIAFVKAQYQITQKWYADHPDASHEGSDGKRYVTLYRGMKFNRHSVPDELSSVDDKGSSVEAESFPLTAWTLSAAKARMFATGWLWQKGYVIAAEVPVDRIFSTGITGTGDLKEGEHIVIGGETKMRAWKV